MDEKNKKYTRVLYVVIGILIAVVIFLAGGKLREISIFGAKIEFPTETPVITSTAFVQSNIASPEISLLMPSPIGTAQLIAPQKVDSQLTGGGVEQTYSKDLKDGEIIVGHSSNVSFAQGTYQKDYWATSFLIVGPGHFDFRVYSGLWDKWTGISQERYKPLLQEQFNVHVLRDGVACSEITTVCIGQEGYIDCPITDCP